MRKTTLALLLLGIPLGASALGLGEIELRSGLNQALNAEIELLSVSAGQLESLSVGLASRQAFAEVGIERAALLSQLRFKVEQRADGAPYIKVFTQEPLREPFLQYLVEVNSPGGRLVREYTLLLDPPTLASQDVIQAPVISTRQASAVQSSNAPPPANNFAEESTYGPVRPGEVLGQIAKGLLGNNSSADVNQLMLAILEANPEAFKNNNINTLKVGATLRIPEESVISGLSKQEARRLVREQSSLWKNARSRPSNTVAGSSVPNLDDIGQDVTSVAATVPPLTQEAILSQLEKSGQEQTESSLPPQPSLVPAESDDARLKLLASADVSRLEGAALEERVEAGINGGAAQNVEIEELRRDLSLATEAVEAKRQENEELSSRLAELEEQTSAIERLLTLKEADIANLQNKLGQTPDNPVVPSVSGVAPDQTTDTVLSSLGATEGVAESSPENGLAPSLTDAIDAADLTPPVTEAEQAATLSPPAPPSEVLPAQPEPVVVAEASQQPVAQPSMLDNIMGQIRGSWLIQALIALALLAAFAAVWFVRRRRNNAEYIDLDMFADASVVNDDPVPTLRVDSSESTTHVDEIMSGIEPALKLAIAKDPSRHDLRLNLLKIYYQAGNTLAFTAAAQQFRAGMKERQSVMWDEIAAMGHELSPANALFAGSGGHAEWNSAAADKHDYMVEAGDMGTNSQGQASDKGVNSAPPILRHDAKADLEFMYREDDHGITVSDAQSHSARVNPAESVCLSLVNGGIAGDKIGTKLDLARAYIEMGDPEGAQSILNEVTKEGSDLYQHQVEELQRRIG